MKTMKIVEEHFSSIHQLLSVISSRPKNSEMAACDSSESNGKEFTGTKNFQEAVDLFQYGYTDVLDKIKSGIASNVIRLSNGVMLKMVLSDMRRMFLMQFRVCQIA